jgi:hypothetical protein
MAGNKHLTPIILPADPTNALEAVTKQYVDNRSTITFVTSGSTTTLPAVASSNGKRMTFKKTDATGTATIDGNASETIDGQLTQTLTTQYESITIYCDGSTWWIV